MLNKLYVKNYALIDQLEIVFGSGLNIITGETGAGKSILMGALSLILGQRADAKQVFDAERKCVIEGCFAIQNYQIESFFAQNDLDYESETIIRREISIDGKSRAFVNDSPVNLQILKQLGERLIDVHSQHATLQLTAERFQFLIVDSVAQNADLLRKYKGQLAAYMQAKRDFQDLELRIAQANTELDYHQFVFSELESAQLQEGELAELEEEQRKLENAEEIKRSLYAASNLLDENPQSVLATLREVQQETQRSGRFVSAAEELGKRLESCWIELKDVAAEIAQIVDDVTVDGERLDFVNTRVSTLYGLIQKYRVADFGELLLYKDNIEAKILEASQQDESLIHARAQVDKLEAEARSLANQLSQKRKAVVAHIEQQVLATLRRIGMPDASIRFHLDEASAFGSFGLDKLSIVFAANKGQSLQPIGKVASGGELSRVMLAIKTLVASVTALPTIIFDEIDTGISGEAALQVGEVMADLSASMQVLAITHLPQIASRGQQHFKVFKTEVDGRTHSQIDLLDDGQRVTEIATMLSGANPEDTAIQHARRLLS